ncbi:hypothetical protein Goarm_019163, partial [Gossypium armourianum]|nr:hypothetical protein [Gossypium armourianum]
MAEQGTSSKLSAPTRPTIALPPTPAMDSLFSDGSGLSPGPMTLVSAFFSNQDSTENRPFSQLLAGAMASPGSRLPYNSMDGSFMDVCFKDGGEKRSEPLNFGVPNSALFTVPPRLSPSGLLNSPAFYCLSPQSPFGISHQQALAQVTAQAAMAQSLNHEETSSQMAPSASGLQSSTMEYAEASQFDGKNQPSVAVDKPAEDGYNWRKYGQKPIKGCEYSRSYYKCTHLKCPVKKKVERSTDGLITEILYKGAHNHEKPQPNKQGTGSSDGNANSQAPELGSQGLTGNLNKLNAVVPACSIPGKNHESTEASELPGSSENEEHCDEEGRDERDNNDEPNPKRRNAATEAAIAFSHKTVTEPKIVVQTRSEVELLDDGYRWRKYGQKVVKGNPHPRSYYKCTNEGCNVRKHVERASMDPRAPKPYKVMAEKHPLLGEMDFGTNAKGRKGANKSATPL